MYTESRLEDLQSMTASNTPNVTWAAFLGTAPHTYHKRETVEKNGMRRDKSISETSSRGNRSRIRKS